MKRIALGLVLWILILSGAIGIYITAPQALEPIVCYPHETLSTNPEYGSGLFCRDDFGNVRNATESIAIPFIFFMVAIPLLMLFALFINRYTTAQAIDNPAEVTWRKRWVALFTAILDTVSMMLHIADPPQHYHVDMDYGDLWREAKAKFAYFFGNPNPLIAYYQELENRSKAKKAKK